ncbi:minor capsid protein [Capybara microvirus Cap1_SP_175]|nr:minor capsid protein [Capybara microvirus Cap1_SP_175]
MKGKYRTDWTEHKITESPTGSHYINEYSVKYDENGHRTVYISGKTNIYEQIQAHAEECKIENILAKYQMTGDESILNQRTGQYWDITDMPKNRMEMLNMIQESKEQFMKLPVEIRAKYNHSWEEYLADAGSENWAKNMGILKEETKIETKEETIENE